MLVDGDNLIVKWVKGASKGSRVLEKGEPEKRPELADYVGTWYGEQDSLKIVWVIKAALGKPAISANYLDKNGKIVGAFVGIDVELKAGKLLFTAKFQKKPRSSWHDLSEHTCEMIVDNVLSDKSTKAPAVVV